MIDEQTGDSGKCKSTKAHNLAVNAIFDLRDSALEGDPLAAERLYEVATTACMTLGTLFGPELPGPKAEDSIETEVPAAVMNHLSVVLRSVAGLPVVVTLHKRLIQKGLVFTPEGLKDYLEKVELGSAIAPPATATSGRNPPFDEFVAHCFREISPCCGNPESFSEDLRRQHPFIALWEPKVTPLPILRRNGLNRDAWIASETGKAWQAALQDFLPWYTNKPDWHFENLFTGFHTEAQRAADRQGVNDSDKFLKSFIINKILAGLHSLAGD